MIAMVRFELTGAEASRSGRVWSRCRLLRQAVTEKYKSVERSSNQAHFGTFSRSTVDSRAMPTLVDEWLSDRNLVPGNGSSWLPNASACRKHRKSKSTCALQSEPVYNHYLLAADSSRKVEQVGRKHPQILDKIVIKSKKFTEIKESANAYPDRGRSYRRDSVWARCLWVVAVLFCRCCATRYLASGFRGQTRGSGNAWTSFLSAY